MAAYRPVLEVCKFLSEAEILSQASYVSRLWQHVTSSSELWLYYIYDIQQFLRELRDSNISPKLHYRHLNQVRSTLVLVTPFKLDVFSCQTEKVMRRHQFPVTIPMNSNSALAFLADGSLFCCGGGEGSEQEVWKVELETGSYRDLALMPVGRKAHGLALHKETIYVFGGIGQSHWYLNAAHQYQLYTDTWFPLPDMISPRAGFNTCIHERRVYLCGGLFTYDSEYFDIDRVLFFPLSFSLPEISDTCVTFRNEFLYIVSNAFISQWSLTTQSLSLRERKGTSNAYGSMNAVQWKDAVYIATWDGIQRIDLNMGSKRAIRDL